MYETSYQIEDRMPLYIKQCLMEGSYTIPPKEWYPDYVGQFYTHYQDTMNNLKLPAVPLVYDAQKRCFSIDPAFMKKASFNELKLYRELVEKRFAQYFRNDFAEETEDVEEDDDSRFDDELDEETYEECDFPELPYRARNETYVGTAIKKLFLLSNALDDDYADDKIQMDDYGLIEDRRAIFFRDLICLCDDYALPKLPVLFDENDNPYFKASAEETVSVQILLRKRMRLEREKKIPIANEYAKFDTPEYQEAENVEEYDDRVQAIIKMNSRLAAINEFHKNMWEYENKTYLFPSQIDCYTVELLNEPKKDGPAFYCRNSDKLLENEEDLVKPEENDDEPKIVCLKIDRLRLS